MVLLRDVKAIRAEFTLTERHTQEFVTIWNGVNM